jgi:hypothetical protein
VLDARHLAPRIRWPHSLHQRGSTGKAPSLLHALDLREGVGYHCMREAALLDVDRWWQGIGRPPWLTLPSFLCFSTVLCESGAEKSRNSGRFVEDPDRHLAPPASRRKKEKLNERTGTMAFCCNMGFSGRAKRYKKMFDENFGRNRTDETTETLGPLLLVAGPRRCGNRIKVKISRLSCPPFDVEGRGASTLWPAGAELQAAPGPHPFGRLAENCSRACGTSHQGLRFCTGSRKAATAGLNRQREHKVEVQGRP